MHSCVPRRHSCRRPEPCVHKSVNAARKSACATETMHQTASEKYLSTAKSQSCRRDLPASHPHPHKIPIESAGTRHKAESAHPCPLPPQSLQTSAHLRKSL